MDKKVNADESNLFTMEELIESIEEFNRELDKIDISENNELINPTGFPFI